MKLMPFAAVHNDERRALSVVDVLSQMGEQQSHVGVTMGCVLGDERCAHSLVLHCQFHRCCRLFGRCECIDTNNYSTYKLLQASLALLWYALYDAISLSTTKQMIWYICLVVLAQLSISFSQEDALEESGWKLVHGDVFRPPQHTKLLTSLIGAGIQLFGSAFCVLCKLA